MTRIELILPEVMEGRSELTGKIGRFGMIRCETLEDCSSLDQIALELAWLLTLDRNIAQAEVATCQEAL